MSYNNSNNNSAASKWTYLGETTPQGTWIPAATSITSIETKSVPTPIRTEPKPWVSTVSAPVRMEPKPASIITVESLTGKANSMGFSVNLKGTEGCWCDVESMQISIDMRQVEQYQVLLNIPTAELLVGIYAHEVGHAISHSKGLNPMDEILAWKHATDLYGGILPSNMVLLRTEALKGYLRPHSGDEAAYVAHIAEVALSREYFRQEEIKRNERKAKEEVEYQAKIADRRRRGTWK